MPHSEKPTSLTEPELATAIRLTVFPNDPDNPDGPHSTLSSLALHTAGEIADALFTVIATRKAEESRWINGRLYTDPQPGAAPAVYQRVIGGWREVGSWTSWKDGDLDTRGFCLLTAGPPAGPGPLKQLNLPGHDVRGTAYSHAQGWYHNCPGCKAAAEANAEHRVRPATEGEH